MVKNEQKYFIAIVPPLPLRDEIQSLKARIGAIYHTKGALRSPPHITLHMPFLWDGKKEEKLFRALQTFAQSNDRIAITLDGFACFAPRVVFLSVSENQPLADLQRKLFRHCKVSLNLFNSNYRDRPFHPHVTLAFRDLRKDQFELLWEEVREQSFRRSFEALQITLLKHDGKQWLCYKEFMLDPTPPV